MWVRFFLEVVVVGILEIVCEGWAKVFGNVGIVSGVFGNEIVFFSV